jgi:acetylornithine deacetylase
MSSLPKLTSMLAQLIAIPSVSSALPALDQGNVGVVEVLAQWLTELGFRSEILPIPGYPNKANLIATLGQGPGGLVLAGHTDTVPFNEERWQHNPLALTEDNQRLYGLGTCDMKGFFPMAISAAQAFAGQKLRAPLIILATADEESSMCGAEALVEMGRPLARYAVIGEPTGMRPVRQHKSIMMESIKIIGQAGHSSNPALGNSALEAMHDVMTRLLDYRRQLQQQHINPGFSVQVPTMNLGCIHGGDNPNRICPQCELHFDARLLPGMSNDAVRDDIRALVAGVALERGIDIQLHSLFKGVAAFMEREDSALIKVAEQLTGYPAESVAFATEAPFLQQLGIETLIMGPGSIDQAHQPDEFIELSSIEPCVAILRDLIKRFCL